MLGPRFTETPGFFRECLAEARRDLFSKAERWKLWLGLPGLWLCLYVLGMAASLPSVIGGQIVLEAVTFAVAAACIFLFELVRAPANISRRDRAQIRTLERRVAELEVIPPSAISISLIPGPSMLTNDLKEKRLKSGFQVLVENTEDKALKECELLWDAVDQDFVPRREFFLPSSELFSMRPKEKKEFTIVWAPHDNFDDANNYAEPVTHWGNGLFASESGAVPILSAGGVYDFKVRVLSEGTFPANAKFILRFNGHEWTMT